MEDEQSRGKVIRLLIRFTLQTGHDTTGLHRGKEEGFGYVTSGNNLTKNRGRKSLEIERLISETSDNER